MCKQFVCPLLQSEMCYWTGKLNEILLHFQSKHPEKIKENPCNLSCDASCTFMDSYLLSDFNSLFCIRSEFSLSTRKFHHCVQLLSDNYVGTLNTNYKFALEVTNKNGTLEKKKLVEFYNFNDLTNKNSVTNDVDILLKVMKSLEDATFVISIIDLTKESKHDDTMKNEAKNISLSPDIGALSSTCNEVDVLKEKREENEGFEELSEDFEAILDIKSTRTNKEEIHESSNAPDELIQDSRMKQMGAFSRDLETATGSNSNQKSQFASPSSFSPVGTINKKKLDIGLCDINSGNPISEENYNEVPPPYAPRSSVSRSSSSYHPSYEPQFVRPRHCSYSLNKNSIPRTSFIPNETISMPKPFTSSSTEGRRQVGLAGLIRANNQLLINGSNSTSEQLWRTESRDEASGISNCVRNLNQLAVGTMDSTDHGRRRHRRMGCGINSTEIINIGPCTDSEILSPSNSRRPRHSRRHCRSNDIAIIDPYTNMNIVNTSGSTTVEEPRQHIRRGRKGGRRQPRQ